MCCMHAWPDSHAVSSSALPPWTAERCRAFLLVQLGHLATIALTVLASFALAWAPFLASKDSLMAVMHRLFPTQRGLFEDYVANFW